MTKQRRPSRTRPDPFTRRSGSGHDGALESRLRRPHRLPTSRIVGLVPFVGNIGPSRSVTKQRKSTSHGLHLFLTIVTGGVWGLCVWLPITMWHKMGPKKKITTEHY